MSEGHQNELDVVVVGAGLSGIGAGYHLQTHCPGKRYAIFEARESLGGTWDLFRYPGIRSDSDMYTLGYSFRPWTHPKAIADGKSILDYLRDTAATYGIDRKIQYGQRVERASWSSREQRWTVQVRDLASDSVREVRCAFLLMCAGYYDYDQGYLPEFPGKERFQGRIVHPQHWPQDLDYSGKRVVVIGSGATAVTLVPELAKRAAHVTMLQRSPTYILSRPDSDPVANWLRERISSESAYALTRWKNVILTMGFYQWCKRFPEQSKRVLVELVRHQLRGKVDADPHFTPHYNPWDQRLCLVPNGDLFKSLRKGQSSVVTDHIETFTETGVLLKSGRELEADVIVTATGLRVKFLGGMKVDLDGQPVDLSKSMTYRGMMCSDVPNLAFAIGYTNASWTLKCDLTFEYFCRLLNHMEKRGYTQFVPRNTGDVEEESLMSLSAGYLQRAQHLLPRQGKIHPWKLYQNYALDRLTLRHSKIEDGALQFLRAS
ncbi:MAG: NAD(P)/FAD-dependent oxidoreductase [Myxococcales bacterium]